VRQSRRPITLLALLLVLALVAGACGGDDKKTTTSAGGGTDTGKGESATSNDVNPTDRADVKDGGTLTWVLDGFPANFNYNQIDGTDNDAYHVISALLPSVFDFKADSTPVLKKEYVTKAEVTSQSPKQVITYTLNPKAKWNDGKPITYADFEAQWKASNGTNEAYTISASQGYEDIESVTKGKDEYEVVVTFSKPYSDWRGLFSPLYPAATNSDPKVFNEGWVDKPIASAGPFKLQGVDQTAKTITLVRDDAWWGDKAKLDRIVYRVIDSDAQIDALANGEIDFQDIGADVDALKRAEGIETVEIRRAAGPNYRHFDFNGTSEVLKDVNVRRAIALGIDRATIAKALIGPLGIKPVPLNNHIFMTNQKGYKNNAGDLATADATKAKALLDKAGWVPGANGIRAKAGKPLTVRFVIPSEVASSQKEGELIQGMLKPIGIDFKIDVVPSDDFFDKYITPGDFDMTVFSWIGTPFPISSSKSIYSSPQGDDIQQNYSRIGTPEIDKLFGEATAELDPAKAIDLANQIDEAIWNEVHSLTVYQRPDIVAAKKTLANYGAIGFATVRYEDLGFVK
jgi:peptide/nickel transport system substrate-binding protein